MKRVLFVIVLLCGVSFAQSNVPLSKGEYQDLVSKLNVKKDSLLAAKEALKSDIEKLTEKKNALEEKLKTVLYDFYIKKYGKVNGKRVFYGQIWKGMTTEMMKDAWGKPDKIESNKEKWGLFERWFYGEVTYFFRDKKLIDWEEKK